MAFSRRPSRECRLTSFLPRPTSSGDMLDFCVPLTMEGSMQIDTGGSTSPCGRCSANGLASRFDNLTMRRAKWLASACISGMFMISAPGAALAACTPSGANSGVHAPASGNAGVHTGVNPPPSTGSSGGGSKGSCSSAVNAGAENVVPSGAAHVAGAGAGAKSGATHTALNATAGHNSAKSGKEVHARP
jgi:hypothetical protein